MQAFNWEDINSNISMEYARAHSDKIPCGGISSMCMTCTSPDRDALKEKLRQRVKVGSAGGRQGSPDYRPGCVVPTDVPEYRLTVLKEVVEELG